MCEGYELNFAIAFEKVNGTLTTVLRPVITKCPEDPGPIIAGTFLSVIFVAAFLLNMMVVVTVATSYTLKKFLYCHLLINLCITCMIDCFLNITVAIAYVTTAPWHFGFYLSYFNGFTINMLNSEMAFAVLLLTIDRIAAVKKCTKYLNMAKYKVGLLIGLTWLVAFVLALPLLSGLVLSMPYKNRYSCSVADPQDDYYLIIHVVLVMCVSTVVMISLILVTNWTFHRERKRQKKIKGNQTMGYFDQILMTPYYRNEFYPAVFVSFAVIAYLICWLPFLTLSSIGPILTKHWANETEEDSSADDMFSRYIPVQGNGFRMTRAMLDESQLQKLNNTNITSDVNTDMSNITVNPGLIPEIIGTPVYETVFVWFRFIFDLLVPILVFSILKDVREKCEGLIMCCRPNSVSVASPKPIRRPYIDRLPSRGSSEHRESKGESKKKPKNPIAFKTPILFATSDGLHIRTIEETYLDMIESKPLIGFPRLNNDAPKFTYGLCDVMLGYEDLTDFDGQFHIDDNDGYEREPHEAELGAANPVVLAANRAAMGQKPLQDPTEDDSDDAPILAEFRPPTPPKVQIKGNDPAINFGDTIELDIKKNKKGKKNVRFAAVISEEVPRPSTGESSVLNSSINSSRSSDSGIMADNERSSAQDTEDKRKLKVIYGNDQQRITKKNAQGKPIRPPPKRLQGGPSKKYPSPNNHVSSGGKKKTIGTKIRNIRSRHMSKINASLTSLEEKSPPPSRRFSKPSR